MVDVIGDGGPNMAIHGETRSVRRYPETATITIKQNGPWNTNEKKNSSPPTSTRSHIVYVVATSRVVTSK